jgi:hypothetical protein
MGMAGLDYCSLWQRASMRTQRFFFGLHRILAQALRFG